MKGRPRARTRATAHAHAPEPLRDGGDVVHERGVLHPGPKAPPETPRKLYHFESYRKSKDGAEILWRYSAEAE